MMSPPSLEISRVISVEDATMHLTDEMLVEFDGTAGTVRLLLAEQPRAPGLTISPHVG
jgi:hypothetical protein